MATAKWELKKASDGFISKHNTHDLHDLYFPKGVLNRNEGENNININKPYGLN